MRLKSDLFDVLMHATDGTLDQVELQWDRRVALGVVMAAHGYPLTPRKGDAITGLPADGRRRWWSSTPAPRCSGGAAASPAAAACCASPRWATTVKARAAARLRGACDGIHFDGAQYRTRHRPPRHQALTRSRCHRRAAGAAARQRAGACAAAAGRLARRVRRAAGAPGRADRLPAHLELGLRRRHAGQVDASASRCSFWGKDSAVPRAAVRPLAALAGRRAGGSRRRRRARCGTMVQQLDARRASATNSSGWRWRPRARAAAATAGAAASTTWRCRPACRSAW